MRQSEKGGNPARKRGDATALAAPLNAHVLLCFKVHARVQAKEQPHYQDLICRREIAESAVTASESPFIVSLPINFGPGEVALGVRRTCESSAQIPSDPLLKLIIVNYSHFTTDVTSARVFFFLRVITALQFLSCQNMLIRKVREAMLIFTFFPLGCNALRRLTRC